MEGVGGQGEAQHCSKRRGGGHVDGKKFLESDLRRLAKAGESLQPATKLAALLGRIKSYTAATPNPKKTAEFQEDYENAKAELGKLGVGLPNDIEITALIDLLGKELTGSLHPEKGFFL